MGKPIHNEVIGHRRHSSQLDSQQYWSYWDKQHSRIDRHHFMHWRRVQLKDSWGRIAS